MNKSIIQLPLPQRQVTATLLSCLAFLVTVSWFPPQTSFGATVVPCGVPIELETWTAAGSPYLISCDVQVDSLAIQPDVTVLFLSNSTFRVTGWLHAIGMSNAPILFTSTNPAVKWQGIFFEEVAPGSVLRHCVVEGSGNSGVRAQNCGPEIVNCVFRDNVALEGGAISVDNTSPGLGGFSIVGCSFVRNSSSRDGGAIHITHTGAGSGQFQIAECSFVTNASSRHGGAVRANVGGNSILFETCWILNNTANPPSSIGDYVGGGLYITGDSSFNNCLIAGNTVNSCTSSGVRSSKGGGIYLDGNADAVLQNCILTNNTAAVNLVCGGGGRAPEAYGGGILLANGTLSLRNCILAYNKLGGSLNTAHGGAINTGSGRATLENCTVAYNTVGGGTSGGSGMSAGPTTFVHNSIVYFNSPESGQLAGTTNVSYCDVQGGLLPGPGNKSVSPNLGPLTEDPATCLRILGASQCVDMGDPNPIYNDLCFPPSRGTARNDMGAHGGPGACCWGAPCDCPVLGELAPQATCAGMNATFCATTTGARPLSYQWRYHGANSTDPPMDIPNATNACLTLNNVQTNHAGFYSVRVSDPVCMPVESNPAQLLVYPTCFTLNLYPGLSISGQVGRTYRVRYTTELTTNSVWTCLTNFTLTTPEYFFLDPHPARHCDSTEALPPRRFYRVDEGACP